MKKWFEFIAFKSLKQLNRDDIEDFVRFCQKPNKSWIGVKKATRFIEKDGLRISNPDWRPFVVTISKLAYRKGNVQIANILNFHMVL